MPKLTVSSGSSALNADILAVFDELGLDPIKEMAEMVTKGAPVVGPDGITKYVQLDPGDRFKVLKELAEYTAPKLKAVDVSSRKQQKTIVKVMQHGQKAVIANGSDITTIENRDYTKPYIGDGSLLKDAVKETVTMKPIIRSAAQLEAYALRPGDAQTVENNE